LEAIVPPSTKGTLVTLNVKKKGSFTMNWDRMEGQWKQNRGKALRHWGNIMNDELSAIMGKNEELVGKLQEKQGIEKEETSVLLHEYKIIVKQLKQANIKLKKMDKELGKRNFELQQLKIKESSKKRK
jgi:uncharacterized protein YjbJ (UPF0337 family)